MKFRARSTAFTAMSVACAGSSSTFAVANQTVDVVAVDQIPRSAILHECGEAADSRRDHGRPARGRLESDEPE